MAHALRILIADDNERFRLVVSRYLAWHDDMQVTSLAACGEDALESLRQDAPDVAVVDLQMPGIGGIETIRRMKLAAPELRVVAITAHGDDYAPAAVLEAGADAFVEKQRTAELLVDAICGLNQSALESTGESCEERAPPGS